MSCPTCGGPLSLGVEHWRAYCLECGTKPFPLPRMMAADIARIESTNPDVARARIRSELKDSPVTFDPTHPSNT